MAQIVTRVEDDLAIEVDQLVADGVVSSRSEAVRIGLRTLTDQHRRRRIGEAIVAGYEAIPQTDAEQRSTRAATERMIAEEPW